MTPHLQRHLSARSRHILARRFAHLRHRPKQPLPPPGWGDKLHTLLLPLARRFDARFGTHLAQCRRCQRRRSRLNRWGRWFEAKYARLKARLTRP